MIALTPFFLRPPPRRFLPTTARARSATAGRQGSPIGAHLATGSSEPVPNCSLFAGYLLGKKYCNATAAEHAAERKDHPNPEALETDQFKHSNTCYDSDSSSDRPCKGTFWALRF